MDLPGLLLALGPPAQLAGCVGLRTAGRVSPLPAGLWRFQADGTALAGSPQQRAPCRRAAGRSRRRRSCSEGSSRPRRPLLQLQGEFTSARTCTCSPRVRDRAARGTHPSCPHGGERTAKKGAARATPHDLAGAAEGRHGGPCTDDETAPPGLEDSVARRGPSGAPPSPLCRVQSRRQVPHQPTVKKSLRAKRSWPLTDG